MGLGLESGLEGDDTGGLFGQEEEKEASAGVNHADNADVPAATAPPASAVGTAATDADAPGGNDTSRPALHPFDSLSAPLSIGDCLAVAEQQSRGVLAEAGGGRALKGVEAKREQLGERQASSRDARGRVRLGYVSGDLMGTHPLTHLMQVKQRPVISDTFMLAAEGFHFAVFV